MTGCPASFGSGLQKSYSVPARTEKVVGSPPESLSSWLGKPVIGMLQKPQGFGVEISWIADWRGVSREEPPGFSARRVRAHRAHQGVSFLPVAPVRDQRRRASPGRG